VLLEELESAKFAGRQALVALYTGDAQRITPFGPGLGGLWRSRRGHLYLTPAFSHTCI
jgi:hypothetical protein